MTGTNKAQRPTPQLPATPGLPGPPVDLFREGDQLVVQISLPGTKAGDFRVSLVGNRQLYIEGTVPYRHPVPKENLGLSERVFGPFSRTVQLPLPVDSRGAALTFQAGVLTARLPVQMQVVPFRWMDSGMGPGGESRA